MGIVLAGRWCGVKEDCSDLRRH